MARERGDGRRCCSRAASGWRRSTRSTRLVRRLVPRRPDDSRVANVEELDAGSAGRRPAAVRTYFEALNGEDWGAPAVWADDAELRQSARPDGRRRSWSTTAVRSSRGRRRTADAISSPTTRSSRDQFTGRRTTAESLRRGRHLRSRGRRDEALDLVRPRLVGSSCDARLLYPLRVAADKYPERTIFVCRDERWTLSRLRPRDRPARGGVRGARADRAAGRAAAAERAADGDDDARPGSGRRGERAREPPAARGRARIRRRRRRRRRRSSPTTAFAADAAELRARCSAVEQLFTVDDVDGSCSRPEGAPATEVDRRCSPAMMVYTSGTTGFPKGVVRTHDANLWATVNAALGQPRSTADTEVFVLPLFGIAFIFQVMPMILAGRDVVLDGAFDAARTWELLERHRATRVFLAPTMLDSMLALEGHESRDVSSLRDAQHRLRVPGGGAHGERRSDSATSSTTCTGSARRSSAARGGRVRRRSDERRARPGDDARPARRRRTAMPVEPGVVGEIAMEGPSLMTGYHNARGRRRTRSPTAGSTPATSATSTSPGAST